tara:strand:+ start:3067 stop:3771 length:705 start_codon:yes stop_codon:yes gene_type:complete
MSLTPEAGPDAANLENLLRQRIAEIQGMEGIGGMPGGEMMPPPMDAGLPPMDPGMAPPMGVPPMAPPMEAGLEEPLPAEPMPEAAPMTLEPEPQALPTEGQEGIMAELSPGLIKNVSGQLQAAGLMQDLTDTVTPDLKAAVESVVDKSFPGLYDIENPAELKEAINGIANGSIPVLGAGTPSPERPDEQPGNLPGAGGGLPGAAIGPAGAIGPGAGAPPPGILGLGGGPGTGGF